MGEIVDLAIVGGGVAGMLALTRIAKANSEPTKKFILIEKEQKVGGRLCGMTSQVSGSWDSPLSSVSPSLYEYLAQTIRLDPDAIDLESLVSSRQSQMGSLAAGQITRLKAEDFFSQKAAKCIAGAAAAREWTIIDEWQSSESESTKREQVLAQIWKGSRKSPAAVSMEHLARVIGVPNIWQSSFNSIADRARFPRERPFCGPWRQVFDAWEERLRLDERISFEKGFPVIKAQRFEGDLWEVSTGKSTVLAKNLIIAVPPWSALAWLKNSQWPKEILSLAMRTKPTSLVSLVERVSATLPSDLPDLLLVPAEQIQILRGPSGQLCYAATIDYEESMQAPEVLKAVKRLRRAQAKLHQVLGEEFKIEDDHLALLPVAWAQPLAQGDQKLMSLAAKNLSSEANLFFCGDAYGSHQAGDENLLFSLQNSCSVAI